MTHVMHILNHMYYKVNAYGSEDNGAGKEAEVESPDNALTVSGTS